LALPWHVNDPIIRVEKTLTLKHPRPGVAAMAQISYIGPGLEQEETRAVEVISDAAEEIQRRVSMDNGRTWSEFERLPNTQYFIGDVEIREGGGPSFYDASAGVLLGLWLRQIPVRNYAQWNCFTYWRISRDLGRTWTRPQQFTYEKVTTLILRTP